MRTMTCFVFRYIIINYENPNIILCKIRLGTRSRGVESARKTTRRVLLVWIDRVKKKSRFDGGEKQENRFRPRPEHTYCSKLLIIN